MKDLILKENPNINDYQKYIEEMIEARGFKNTRAEIFMLFLEECGEMAKAARHFEQMRVDEGSSKEEHLDHEIADVFIYLLNICNVYGVDLEKAFREKEEINKKRSWSSL
ncbi:MAG: MazG nucleotide pyrophosphohydrolase domain-containing protein [Candidatus Doudnabacteria bacterium]|nr:MazG nucleotide pyrophosphohydrolase domain-containing protein [bacterium]MDZ4243703.1 MazG nucleotide pyrophosphohydrolase domain-containing protein [Candidatus Doudnabacteria bacterium]